MILQIIISNGILDLVTGILQKLAWELRFGTPLHDPLITMLYIDRKIYSGNIMNTSVDITIKEL